MNFETKSRSDKSSNKDFTGNAKDYAKNIIKPLETQSLTPEFIAFFKKAINIQITKEIIRSNILDSLRNSNSSERNQLTKATFGTGDPKVRIAQASLVLAGYDLGDYGANGVDGKPGKLTIQAIKDFQQAVGLKPNGDLNEPTMFALDFITKKGFMRNEIEFIGKESRDSLKRDIKIDGKGIRPQGGEEISSFAVKEEIKKALPSELKQIEFIEKIAPDAMKIQMETGIPWQVVVAQTCLETGYGKSEPTDKTTGVESKNLHGIKYFGDMSQKNKYVIAWTLEHVSENDLPWWQKNHPELQKTGKIINGLIEIRIKEPFAVFDSYEQSFEKYKKVLTNNYFKHALRNKDDLEKYINDIQSKLPGEEHPKYATDEEYVDKILNIIRRYGLSD